MKKVISLALLASIACSAQANGHPNGLLESWAHFLWHADLLASAAKSGNWGAFLDVLVMQSVCVSYEDMSFIFVPSMFLTILSVLVMFVLALLVGLLRKVIRSNKDQWAIA